MNKINCKAVVNHMAGRARNEFERRRNKAEYDQMIRHIRKIADEPVYRWPENK